MSSPQSMAIPDAVLHTEGSKSPLTGSLEDNKTGFSQEENVDSLSKQLLYRRHGIFSKLMRRVSRLPRLREDFIQEEVLGRQKRRKLGFKMNDISASDARFMREVQGLTALGKLEGFPELLRLANECQQARDRAGPLVADCTEAEQELESKLSELQNAEASTYEFFEKHFHSTKRKSSGSPSPSASQYGSSSSSLSSSSDYNTQQPLTDDFEDIQNDLRYQPTTESLQSSNVSDQMSLDLNEQVGRIDQTINSPPRSHVTSYYSDSIFSGGIDHVLESGPDPVFTIPAYPSHPQPLTDIENYPRLLLEFTTVRERVTNWLLHSLLLSRWEVGQLKSRLDAEDPNLPSNWAQFVVAWWERDMATMPVSGSNQQKNTLSQQERPLVPKNRAWHSEYHLAPEEIRADGYTSTFDDYGHRSVVSDDCTSRGTGRRSPSLSSQTSTTEIIRMGHPFVTLLFECADLIDLFQRVSESIEASIFIVSFKKLLDSFSGALNQEAKNHKEVLAYDSIRRARKKITNLVKERVYDLNTDRNVTPTVNISGLDQDMRINHHLEQLDEGAADNCNLPIKRKDSSDDYDEENESLTSLEHVRDFIMKSGAFDKFRHNLEDILKESPIEVIAPTDDRNGQTTNLEMLETAAHANMHKEKHLGVNHSVSTEDSQTTEKGASPTETFDHPLSMTIEPSPDDESRAATRASNAMWIEDFESVLSPNDPIHRVDNVASNLAMVSLSQTEEHKENRNSDNIGSHVLLRTETSRTSKTEMLPTKGTPTASDTETPQKAERQAENLTAWNDQGKEPRAEEISESIEASNCRKNSADAFPFHEELDCDYATSPSLMSRSDEIVTMATNQAGTVERAETGGLIQPSLEPGQETNTPTSRTRISRTSNRKEEKFDKRYKEHERPEFAQGKVFKVLWSEPKDSGGEGGTVISVRRGAQGDNVTEKVRRFVIIEAKPEHCLCLSIMTYGGRGTTKGGVSPDNHAIIYTEKPVLMEGEADIAKQPIRVKPYSPQYKLEDASRLNYAKAYTVEYDVKVWFIGEVHQDSKWKLITACHEMLPPFQTRIAPPTLSSCSTTSLIPAEPPTPLMEPAQDDEYPAYKLTSATLSQSSGASIIPVTAPQQLSTGQRQGAANTAWEAPKTASNHGPLQYSLPPYLAGKNTKSSNNNVENQCSQSPVRKHDLYNGK